MNDFLTLNDIEEESLRGPLHSVELRRADVVGIEARVEAVDENATVSVDSEVHCRWHSGAIVHAKAYICSLWVGQQAGQQVALALLPHHLQGCAAGPENTTWIWKKENAADYQTTNCCEIYPEDW